MITPEGDHPDIRVSEELNGDLSHIRGILTSRTGSHPKPSENRLETTLNAARGLLAIIPSQQVITRESVSEYRNVYERSLAETGMRGLALLEPYGYGLNAALIVSRDRSEEVYYQEKTKNGNKLGLVLQTEKQEQVWFVNFVTQNIPLDQTPKSTTQRLFSWLRGEQEEFIELCERVSFFRADHHNLKHNKFYDTFGERRDRLYAAQFDAPQDYLEAHSLHFDHRGSLNGVTTRYSEKYTSRGEFRDLELVDSGLELFQFNPESFSVGRFFVSWQGGFSHQDFQRYNLSQDDGLWRRGEVPERNIPAGELPVELEVYNILKRLPVELIPGFDKD